MSPTLEALIAADDFQWRMKKGEAALKARMEKLGYNFKRNVAKTYCETVEWRTKFITPAIERRKLLENGNLTIEDLIEESEDQLLEAFAYFLCLSPEQQQRTAQQFKDGLAKVSALHESNRERAQRMIERREKIERAKK
jgi:hypothetical protein